MFVALPRVPFIPRVPRSPKIPHMSVLNAAHDSRRLFCLRDADRFDHLSHGAVESDEGRPRDDVVSDVEFFDFRYTGDRADVAISQPMTGRDLQSGLRRQTRGRPDAQALLLDLANSAHGRVTWMLIQLRVTRRAYLDLISAEFRRGFNLLGVGIDEETDKDARVIQFINALADRLSIRYDVEPPLSGDFLRPFGHQRHDVRLEARGDLYHLVSRGHFDVEVRDDHLFERDQIIILNVTTVAAKMGSDSVSPRQFANHGGGNRVRFVSPASLTNGGYVINVDVQSAHRICQGDYST